MVDRPYHWSDRLSEAEAGVLGAYSSSKAVIPDAEAPVLVVIDVTEAFVGPDVAIAAAQKVSRKACGERAWAAIPNIGKLIEAFRSHDLPIVYTRPDPLQQHIGPATRRPDAAMDKDLSDAFAGGIEPRPGEIVMPKVKASVFFGTPISALLNRLDRRTLVLVGGTTSGCIRASAVDATSYGFGVLVAEDAVFDRVDLIHDVSLIDISAKYGSVLSTETIVGMLG